MGTISFINLKVSCALLLAALNNAKNMGNSKGRQTIFMVPVFFVCATEIVPVSVHSYSGDTEKTLEHF